MPTETMRLNRSAIIGSSCALASLLRNRNEPRIESTGWTSIPDRGGWVWPTDAKGSAEVRLQRRRRLCYSTRPANDLDDCRCELTTDGGCNFQVVGQRKLRGQTSSFGPRSKKGSDRRWRLVRRTSQLSRDALAPGSCVLPITLVMPAAKRIRLKRHSPWPSPAQPTVRARPIISDCEFLVSQQM